MSVLEIEEEIARLGKKARDNKLTMEGQPLRLLVRMLLTLPQT